jgi:hypothetical protein
MKPSIKTEKMKWEYDDKIMLMTADKNDQIGSLFMEFQREGQPLYIFEDNKLKQIKAHYVLYEKYDEDVYNKHISSFEALDEARHIFYCQPEHSKQIDELVQNIESVDVTVLVNWMPLFTFKIGGNYQLHDGAAAWGFYGLFSIGKLTKNEKPLVARYEELFAEKESHKP